MDHINPLLGREKQLPIFTSTILPKWAAFFRTLLT